MKARRALIDCLSKKGPIRPLAIEKVTGLAQATVRRHIRDLIREKMVRKVETSSARFPAYELTKKHQRKGADLHRSPWKEAFGDDYLTLIRR